MSPASAIFEGVISCLTAEKAFHIRHMLRRWAGDNYCLAEHIAAVTTAFCCCTVPVPYRTAAKNVEYLFSMNRDVERHSSDYQLLA